MALPVTSASRSKVGVPASGSELPKPKSDPRVGPNRLVSHVVAVRLGGQIGPVPSSRSLTHSMSVGLGSA
jgi:hypothetical protein